MTVVTYTHSDAYPTISGATVNYANGQLFDISAALNAGGGSFSVDSTVGSNSLLIPALDLHPAVKRTGTTGANAQTPSVYQTVVALTDPVGKSEALKRKRDGTILWVGDTHIDMSAYGLPTDGTSDCTPSFAAMRAAEPSGGVVRIPRGVYRLLTDLDLTWGQYDLMGEGKFNTTLWASNDTITGTNAQTGGTTAVTLKADAWGEKFSLVGPLSMNKNNTGSAPKRSGINLHDRCWLRDVRVEAFNNGIQIDGNHQTIYNCVVTNCLYNIAWAQNSAGYTLHEGPSFTHGNQTMIDVDLTGAGFASIMIDGNSKIDSSTFQQVHMGFCQRGIDALAKAGQQIAIGNTSFYDCSFESVGDTYINDLGWNTANRRLMAYVQFFNQLTGPQDPTYSNIGGGLEMIKWGIVQDVRIHGRVGDNSNTSFGSVGWGTTSTACGFRFEQVNGFFFEYADTLWSNAGSQGKPMFRWEGGVIDWSDVYFTILDGGYVCSALKNGSAGTLTNEKLVCGVTAGNPTGTSGVKHYDGTGPAIGRVIAGGPLTTGLIVPVAYEGRFNGPFTTDATIVAGTAVTPDSANAGVKKRTTADQPEWGVAHAAPGVGVGAGNVLVSFRGPWTARF